MTKNVYIVKKGDCLSIIAKKHGISLGKLLSLNPNFRINPYLIYPGQAIKISKLSTITETSLISKMLFDGSYLTIYSLDKEAKIAKYPAISGLPPKAPHLLELIVAGRKDLDIETDYTLPKYQNVKNAG